jgi:hypothetical protein
MADLLRLELDVDGAVASRAVLTVNDRRGICKVKHQLAAAAIAARPRFKPD